MSIQEIINHEYQYVCNTPGDIQEHLPTLKALADQCRSVTEFGVRQGISTRALLASSASRFRFYDIAWDGNIQWLVDVCKEHKMDVDYLIADDLKITIDTTDFLFIDTCHTYQQLGAELSMHHEKVTKYIGLHDTEHNGTIGEFGERPGLTGAVFQFLAKHPEWKVKAHYTNNNGFTVLERIAPSFAKNIS